MSYSFLPRPVAFVLIGIILLTAAGSLYIALSNPEQVHNENDLAEISSRFRDYNWSENGTGKKLSFKLQEFKEKFIIRSEFIPALKVDSFKTINYGEPVTILIPAFAKKYLNTREKKIPAYGIRKGNQVLLDSRDTLNEVKKRSRTLLMLTIAGALIISLLMLLFMKKKTA